MALRFPKAGHSGFNSPWAIAFLISSVQERLTLNQKRPRESRDRINQSTFLHFRCRSVYRYPNRKFRLSTRSSSSCSARSRPFLAVRIRLRRFSPPTDTAVNILRDVIVSRWYSYFYFVARVVYRDTRIDLQKLNTSVLLSCFVGLPGFTTVQCQSVYYSVYFFLNLRIGEPS